jgi:hypothetical protein
MSQLALAGGQPLTDLSQGPCCPELTKQHGDKLSPAGKTARMTFSFVFLDGLLELLSWEQLEQLGKNGTYSIQGGCLL